MQYPDLTKEEMICFDIETYDPNLITQGTGVYRKDSYILGVGIAVNGYREYYGLNHKELTRDEKTKNYNYIKAMLETATPKVNANILYDLDHLHSIGIKPAGEFNDVQVAEPLLDEYGKYSLNILGEKYIGQGKATDEIYKWCEDNNLKGDARAHLWRMPYDIVRRYCLVDVEIPIEIFKKQKEELIKQDLWDLYQLEIGLIPITLQMRQQGVRVNEEKAKQKREFLETEIEKREKEIKETYKIDYGSGTQIAKIFDRDGVEYPRHEPTKNMLIKGMTVGNPWLTEDNLADIDHPLAKMICDIRSYKNIQSKFFSDTMFNFFVNGRVHCNFHQLPKDSISASGKVLHNGTVSGRWSSSVPNLQQIPSKKGTMGQFCRELFEPEENCEWAKLDYSQIEFKLWAHYATGPGSEEVRYRYNNDKTTDFHKVIQDLTGLERKAAKQINFGIGYGMGAGLLATKLKVPYDQAKRFMQTYNELAPFVKTTCKSVENTVRKRGYIYTILKRRARLTDKQREENKEYKFFNRLMQGSAADIFKKAMLDAYKTGIFNTLPLHLIVHDEMDVSVPKTPKGIEALKELKHIMETTVELKVPLTVGVDIGENWGNLKEIEL